MVTDQEAANATTLSNANQAVTAANAEIAKVAGLADAIANYKGAQEVTAAAAKTTAAKTADLAGAVATYESLSSDTLTAQASGAYKIGATDVIVVDGTTNKLKLATGITETTNPGITAVLNASQAKEDATAAQATATTAEASALKAVNVLDLDAVAAGDLSALATAMGLDATAKPTQAQIDTKIGQLVGLLQTEVTGHALASDAGIAAAIADPTKANTNTAKTNAEAAAVSASQAVAGFAFVVGPADADAVTAGEITTATTKLATDLGTLKSAIEGAFDTDNADTKTAVTGLLTTAKAAELISAADETAILSSGEWAAIGDVQADIEAFLANIIAPLVDTNNNSDEFEAAVTAYNKAGAIVNKATDLYNLADKVDAFETSSAANNPLLADLTTKQAAATAADKAITDLAEALTAMQSAESKLGEVNSLDKAIADITKAITDMDYTAPVVVEGVAKNATAASDLFILGSNDGIINNFGLLGDDVLFVGKNLTLVELGATQVITDKVGDANVLEVFVKQIAGDTLLYIEQETFAGNGSTKADIIEITLSGVTASDLDFNDGMFTIA